MPLTGGSEKFLYSNLMGFDKNRNGAISFREFLAMLQTKPWSALLRKDMIIEAISQRLDMSQIAAVAKQKHPDKTIMQSVHKLFNYFDVDGALMKRKGFRGERACCFMGCHLPKGWGVDPMALCRKQTLYEVGGS
jgi:hypothetical protein